MAIRKALVSCKDSFDKFNQLGGDVAGARPRPSTAPALDVCEWSSEGLHDKSVPNTDEILKLVKKKKELIGLHLSTPRPGAVESLGQAPVGG